MFSYNTRLRTRARFKSQPLYFLNARAGGSSEIISIFIVWYLLQKNIDGRPTRYS